MAETTTKRHPIRAAFWGLVLGLGVFILLTLVYPVIALESVSSVAKQGVIVIVIVMALSVVWGLYGPAKKPKGRPPRTSEPMAPAESEGDGEDTGDTSMGESDEA